MTDITVKIFHTAPELFRDACMYSKSDKLFSAERAKNVYLGKEAYGYNLVGEITVRDLVDSEDLTETALELAYARSQNISLPWNPEAPCRSTSMGDILVVDNRVFIVATFGFDLLIEI